MVLGGIIVADSSEGKVLEAIEGWRKEKRMFAELKWTKVSDGKLSEYKSLVDLFFSLAEKRFLLFKSMVIDTSQIDYKTFHKGDKDLGFYKFFYQFILHSFGGRHLSEEDRLRIFFDKRTSKQSLGAFSVILNNGMRKKYGWKTNVVRSVEAVDSKGSNIIQMADVLMGAIGFQNNDCHLRSNARKAKIELADHIAERANLLSLKDNTPFGTDHFGIWKFRFGAKRQK